MNGNKISVAIVTALALSTTASATSVPFTENFAADSANWRNSTGSANLGWQGAGGPDGSSYATGSLTFTSLASGSFVNVARGQQGYGSSGGAFTGDWIGSGVTELSFDIRHNAAVPLGFFVRFAGAANFPGAAIVSFTPVPAGQWTHLSFAIDPANPALTLEGFPFAAVFSAIGNVQIGMTVPSSLGNTDTTVNFDIDRVSIVPAPSIMTAAGLSLLAAGRRKR